MPHIGIFDYDDKLTHPYGCVEVNGTQIELSQLSTAVPGDIVNFDLDTKTIISVQSTNFPDIAGVLLCTGPVMGVVKPGIVYRKFIANNPQFPDILISCRKTQSCPNEFGIVNIVKALDGILYGAYKNKIGTPGNLLDEREYFMYCHNIKRKKYNKKYNIEDYLSDLTPDRTNLTDLNTISVDPHGCKDIDDALSIIETETYYEIYIHIADVSSFIQIGSELDKQGMMRVESLYLNWTQEDMYPQNLVCAMSLFENCNCRSFTTIIYLDKNTLKVEKVNCIKSVVNINKNMSYEEFQQTFYTNNDMNLLYEIGKKLYETGAVTKNIRTEYDSHKMVEVYMILCNSVVAEKIYVIGKYLPISRSHKDISSELNSELDPEISDIINHYKSLKAEYILGKASHDSIGQEFYSHFTSPIRRYADLMTHRLLYYSIVDSSNALNASNTLDVSKFSDILMHINKTRSYIQKGNRESILLDKLYQYHLQNNNVIDTIGNVVSINESSVIVFCKEYDLEIRCPLYSRKIAHLLTIVNDENTINLIHNTNKNSLTMIIGETVHLKIIVTFLAGRLTNKVIGQLLDPDPMELFNFSINDIE